MNKRTEKSEDETTRLLRSADRRLADLEKAVKAGSISIGAALASAVFVGAELQRGGQ